MKRTWRWGLLALALTLLAGCGSEGRPENGRAGGMAEDLPELAQNVGVDSVMVGLVDDAAHGLWALEGAGMAPPESETDWRDVEHYAIQLIGAGSYITYGNPGETDPNWVERTGWKRYSQDLTDAGVRALDAAIRRDVDGVLAAGDHLDRACDGCHQEYGLALSADH